MLKLFDIVQFLNILFIHQFLNGILPQALLDTFSFRRIEHNYSTREIKIGSLFPSIFKTISYGQFSIQNQVTSAWDLIQSRLQVHDLSVLTY